MSEPVTPEELRAYLAEQQEERDAKRRAAAVAVILALPDEESQALGRLAAAIGDRADGAAARDERRRLLTDEG